MQKNREDISYKVGDKVIVLESAKEVSFSAPFNKIYTIEACDIAYSKVCFKETSQCCQTWHIILATELNKVLV